MSIQLALPIQEPDNETFDNFHIGNNQALYSTLLQNFTQAEQRFFYLFGEKSCGKSHLLKAANNYFLQNDRTSLYIPLNKSRYFSPAVLDDLENQELVCLDDLDSVIQQEEWEIAIFDLFNRIKEQSDTILLISASQSPQNIQVRLPDLHSRLSWGIAYQLNGLDEEQKIEVLQRAAHQKGLELPLEVANFLLKRLDRDLTYLLSTLEKLDNASLQAQRKLTIPFVKSCLAL